MNQSKPSYPNKQTILSLLDETVELAESMLAQPTSKDLAYRIGDELIPFLYEARSYVEIGYIGASEVRLGVLNASIIASNLVDIDPNFAPLHSRIRVLQEEASQAARKESQ